MNADTNRLLAVFTEALPLAPAERAAFLEEACEGNGSFRRQLDALLQAHENAGDFLGEIPGDLKAERGGAMAAGEAPGDRIDRYKLLQQIGEGGCGVVFLAEQEEPVRRQVALKVIKPGMDTKSVIARFEAERQALALMDHASIAKVFDAGETESGRPYFVMELVRGIRITDYCDRNSLTTGDRLNLFVQVCQAVQHAHQKGIIHRDLKPSNILVTTTEQGTALPVVIDFGIAKATTNQRLTDKTLFTAFEMLIGTPAYMSPEQAALTSVDVDTRSDIYSLGVLLYELLTGATPFDAGELLKAGLDEVRRVIREQEPVRPSTHLSKLAGADLTAVAHHRRSEPPTLIRAVRGDLDWIVMKALEKDRTRRYETANGLALDVQRFLANEAIAARPPGTAYRLKKLVLRNKLLFAGIGVITALLVAGFAIVIVLLANEREAHRQAEHARTRADADKLTAQAEAAKSRQVTFFLQAILEGAGPTAALGRDTAVLREILDRTDARVAQELPNQPEVEADLRFTMGQVYEDLGAYPQAIAMFERVLELNRLYVPEESPEVACTLSMLGRVLLREKKVVEAAQHTEAALAIWRKLRDEESLNAAITHETLAMVRLRQGKVDEAESLIRRAHAIRLKLLPEDSTEVLDALNNLGTVLFAAGRFAETEQIYRQLLAAKEKRYGPEHPSIAFALQNLGSTLGEQGKVAEAKEVLGRAVVMRRKLLGEQHPSFTASLESLANVLMRSHSHAGAENLYREVLALERQRLGLHDPTVLHAARSLARALSAQRKNRETVSLLDEFLTPEFVQTKESASMLSLRAEALACMGRWNEAAVDAAKLIQHEPDNHEHYHTLAPLLVEGGNLEAYRKLCGEMVARFRNTTSVSTADRMAKDCLIHPASGVELRPVAAMAELAVTKGTDRPAFPFYQLCKSLAEYRQQNFSGAAEWAGKISESTFPYVSAEACAVLAMAQHQLKLPEAARATFTRGIEIVERLFPPSGSSDIGTEWRDWIISRTLLEEARKLLGVSPPANPNPADQ